MIANKTEPITQSVIQAGLNSLGIQPGDHIFVQSDFSQFTKLQGNPRAVLLNGILELLGRDGTLVAPAYVKTFSIRNKDAAPVYDAKTPAYTGTLPNLMLRDSRSIRSCHPTHSMVAIGRFADDFMRGHTLEVASFEPLRRMFSYGGKCLLINCAQRTPGMPTVHLAQYDLGLSQRHWLRHFLCVKQLDSSGEVELIRPREAPGCSRNFDSLLTRYIRHENFRAGFIGPAYSYVCTMKSAYESDLQMLIKNPRCITCDDPRCSSCALRSYNLRRLPVYVAAVGLGAIKRMLGSV